MFINAFMPIIFEIPVCLLRWIVIAKDSGLWLISGNKSHLRFYNTKTTQVYGLIDIYAGPQYFIHFKYAGILNVVYVTMMYGLGLPILFPIALLTFFNYWLVERY